MLDKLFFPAIIPEIILCCVGIIIMVVEPFLKRINRAFSATLTILAFLLAGIFLVLMNVPNTSNIFNGMVQIDVFGNFLRLFFDVIGILLTLASVNFLRQEKLLSGEYFVLLIFAVAGMDFMVIASNLIFLFIGLEILSIATYVLAGYRRESALSLESGIKYFLMGALSSAVILYGIAWLFGTTGSFEFSEIFRYIQVSHQTNQIPLGVLLGIGLILAGFCFKVAVVPFQVWAPDVYQGAPVPVTTFMSVGPKAAGFAVIVRILFQISPPQLPIFTQLLIVSSVLTILVGNLGALPQTNVKRLLAYSSIAHAGYILIGIIVADRDGITALLFYICAYALMNIGAFTIVGALAGKNEATVKIDDFRGVGFRKPLLSFSLAICLISLAGIPSTVGFIGKFFLFNAAWNHGLYALVLFALFGSLISVYFYFKILVALFMQKAENPLTNETSTLSSIVAFLCGIMIIFFGVYPNWLIDLSHSAVNALNLP